MKKHTIISIAVVVVVGLAAFFGGMAVGKSSAAGALRSRLGAFGSGAGTFAARGGQGAGFLTGSVIAMDSQSITLQDRAGSSHIVLYSTSTAVSKPTVVPSSDIQTGDNVTVMGTANSDGSFTASSIDIRPAGPAASGTQQAPMIPVGQ